MDKTQRVPLEHLFLSEEDVQEKGVGISLVSHVTVYDCRNISVTQSTV